MSIILYVHCIWYGGNQCVLFLANFRNLATKKKGGVGRGNPTKGFLRFFFKFAISRKKNLEVARFRQGVPVGRQN